VGKTVFIDFDGTFADQGVIPEQHIAAVREARRRGHRILLCTGRPKSLVTAEELDVFDGLVGAAGGYVELNGEVLADRRFPAELASRAVDLLHTHNVAYILEAPEAVYTAPGMLARFKSLLTGDGGRASGVGKTGHDILNAIRTSENPAAELFGKITCFDSAVPMISIADQLGSEVGLVPSSLAAFGDRAGELFLADVNKSVGIEIVSRHFGLDADEIIAIGDGYNDLEMLEYAGTAVAVTGSPQPLLELADLVVATPADHGLVDGFARLGLTG
jgi:Cof subfamily protein (haloacid dehalogenase superfamily)